MSFTTRTNLSLLSLFDQSLDAYEQAIVPNAVEPQQYLQAADHLQLALSRLLVSDSVSSYQMLRSLTKRAQIGLNGPYSEFAILMVGAASQNMVFKTLVNLIMFNLNKILRGVGVVFDESFDSQLNLNTTIRAFMTRYPTSDLARISGITPTNVICTTEAYPEAVATSAANVLLSLGETNPNVTLTSAYPQKITLVQSQTTIYPTGYDNSQPDVVVGKVKIKPSIGQFKLDHTITMSDGVIALLDNMKCAVPAYQPGQITTIYTPSSFYTCELEVASFDRGKTWLVGNILIIPPVHPK